MASRSLELLVGGCLVLSANPVEAHDEAVTSVRSVEGDHRLDDLRLEIYIGRALNEDPKLAGLNVGIKVRDHIVTLWGSVPNAQKAQAVEATARQVLGVAKVLNDLRVEPAESPAPPSLQPSPAPPPAVMAAPRPVPPPGVLVGRPNDMDAAAPPTSSKPIVDVKLLAPVGPSTVAPADSIPRIILFPPVPRIEPVDPAGRT